MNKLTSIILPTYNGANRIREAIESILEQSYINWELLIIDDGSTDNIKEIIDNFIQKDSRIKYIKNEINLGIQKTLNRGLREAKGEYIARIDDDDIWCDIDKLKKQIEFLEDNKDYVLIGTGVIIVDEKGKEIFRHINPGLDKNIRKEILKNNCFLHSSVVFRKDIVLQYGGYSELEDIKHIEDYNLWLKLGTLGKFANLSIYSVRLTLREGSISSKNKIKQFRKSIGIIKQFKKEYPNYILAVISLFTRMIIYRFLQIKPFKYFFNTIYKLYKNI